MTDTGERELHLTPEQTAGYLDEVLTEAERATVEIHLAACFECRDEVVALRSLVSARTPRRRILRAGIAMAAAAAAVVVLMVSSRRVTSPAPSTHRDPSQGPATVVMPRTPPGPASRPLLLAWSPLDQARRYRVLVFDAEGRILYRAETADSALPLPDSLRLSPGQAYFWKVEADTGWDRWVSSRLVEFSVKTTGKGGP